MSSPRKSPAPAATGSRAQQCSRRSNHSPADLLLSRLEAVRETGADRWLACCPAHEDRTPSLSVRETSDGALLVHCFAGCAPADLLGAVGLELSDLFPDRRPERKPLRRGQRRIPAADALAFVDHEALTVAVIASDIRQHRTIDEPTWHRLATAAARIGAAREATR